MDTKSDTVTADRDSERKPVDMGGAVFKVALLAIVLVVGFFLVKPVWDDLFQTLPNNSAPQTREKTPAAEKTPVAETKDES